jgi:hypothetical protein
VGEPRVIERLGDEVMRLYGGLGFQRNKSEWVILQRA